MNDRIRHSLWFATSLLLGSVFAYAGVIKLLEPHDFADSIASYRILSSRWINPLALTLPWFELLIGLLLITSFQRRAASLFAVFITLIFGIALFSAIVRGLQIYCGCFGLHEPTKYAPYIALARDGALLVLSAVLYQHESQQTDCSKGVPFA